MLDPERFVDVGVGSAVVPFDLFLDPGFGREQNHGDVAQPGRVLDGRAELVAVRSRHADVANDQIGHLFAADFQAFLSVVGVEQVVVLVEDVVQQAVDLCVVFHDEQRVGFFAARLPHHGQFVVGRRYRDGRRGAQPRGL